MSDRRIALCISGQVRVEDDQLRQVAEQAKAIGADVFVSVWRQRGGKRLDGGVSGGVINRTLGEVFAACCPQHWRAGFGKIVHQRSGVFVDDDPITHGGLVAAFGPCVTDIEDDTLDLDYPPEKHTLRMLYRIWRCNGLKQAREKESGHAYDLVIRSRPDILLDLPRLVSTPCQPGNLLIRNHSDQVLPDTYWACDSKTDDAIARLFGVAVANPKGWKGIHKELRAHVDGLGLDIVNVDVVRSNFVEFGSYGPERRARLLSRFAAYLASAEAVRIVSALDQCHQTNIGNLQSLSLHLGTPEHGVSAMRGFAIPPLPDGAPDRQWAETLASASMCMAGDCRLSASLRAQAAVAAIIQDYLHNTPIAAQRVACLPRIMPDCIAQVWDIVSNSAATWPQDGPQGLAQGWALCFSQFSPEQLLAARQALRRQLVNDTVARSGVVRVLEQQGHSAALLAFAEFYLQSYPDRRNAHTLMAQARRFAEAAGAAKAVGGA